MAWTARCHYSRVHSAAVLWWTKSSLPTDSSAFRASDLIETTSCDFGTATLHASHCHIDNWHAQPLVCSCCNRHFMVHVCRVSGLDTDYAC